MLKFRNEDVRGEFHLLPLSKQKEFTEMAERFSKKGMNLTIMFIDHYGPQTLEVSIRINDNLHLVPIEGN